MSPTQPENPRGEARDWEHERTWQQFQAALAEERRLIDAIAHVVETTGDRVAAEREALVRYRVELEAAMQRSRDAYHHWVATVEGRQG